MGSTSQPANVKEKVMQTKQLENKPVKICPSFETLKAMYNVQVTP